MGTTSDWPTVNIEIIGTAASGEFEARIDYDFPGGIAISMSDVQHLGLFYTDLQTWTVNGTEIVDAWESPTLIKFNEELKGFALTIVSEELSPIVGQKFLQMFDINS